MIVYPWPDYGILNLTTPLTEDQLVPLPASVRVVQVQGPLDERGWIRLAAFLREYPSTGLSIGANFYLADLAFLRHFAFLRSLSLHAYGLTSFDGLELLDPRFLRRLSLGATASKAPSLALVARFTGLRALSIDGHVKGIDALTGLPNLRHLRLRRVRLPRSRGLDFDAAVGNAGTQPWRNDESCSARRCAAATRARSYHDPRTCRLRRPRRA